MKTYNGHKNYNYWNVALWIANDEGLYNLAREEIRVAGNKDQAALSILQCLKDLDIEKTPDGAPYTLSSVRAAIVGFDR